ncbi:MAG: hypothetical protein ACR5LF_13380 [Symbiopectobacterium sp.]
MLYQFIEYTTRHRCWQRPAHPASACSNRWRTPQSNPMEYDRLLLEIHNVLHAETVVGILCHRLLLMDHAQQQQQLMDHANGSNNALLARPSRQRCPEKNA